MPRVLALPAALAAGAALVGLVPPAGATGSAAPADDGLIYRSVARGDGARITSRVVVSRPDGAGARTVVRTARGSIVGQLRVSGDGRTLAYVERTTARSGHVRVAVKVVPTAGGRPRTLDAGRFATQQVALSPDGATVYYAKFRPASPTVVAETDLERSELYAVPAAGGAPRRLTRDRVDDYRPAVGPDGRVLWTRDLGGRAGTQIWSMAPDGTDRRRVDPAATGLEAADVAADGRVLAARRPRGAARTQLVAIAPGGADAVPIGPADAGGWPIAAWSPDARRVVGFRAVGPAREGRYGVVEIDVATGAVRRAPAAPRGSVTLAVDWAPTPPGR